MSAYPDWFNVWKEEQTPFDRQKVDVILCDTAVQAFVLNIIESVKFTLLHDVLIINNANQLSPVQHVREIITRCARIERIGSAAKALNELNRAGSKDIKNFVATVIKTLDLDMRNLLKEHL